MSATPMHDARCAALDGFLEEREAHGYSIETRTQLQAIIVRRRRLDVLAWFGRRRQQRRLVVSVDVDGTVTSVAAEPRRW